MDVRIRCGVASPSRHAEYPRRDESLPLARAIVGPRIGVAGGTEAGRIAARDESQTLIGRGLAESQTAPLVLNWDPETQRFKGSVRVAAPGGRTKIKFDFRVINQNRLEGELVADVRVDAQGVKATCAVARGVALKRQ